MKMAKKKNITINKEWIILIRILLMLSCPFFTFIVSNGDNTKHIFIGCILSFVISIFIFCKIKIDNIIDKRKLLINIITACYLMATIIPYANNNIVMIQELIKKMTNVVIPLYVVTNYISIFAFPIVLFFVKWFFDNAFDKIIDFFKNLTTAEKKYIYFTLIAASMISIFAINMTVVFSRPNYDYDVIYTSDTGSLLRNDVFVNVSHRENDIRQPLFGIFAMPLGLVARMTSKFCFFFRTGYEYETVITIFQALLLAISSILLARLLDISEDKKKYFYLLVSCSFPYVLFTLLLEQYVIALFYLILAIYYHFKNPYKTDYLYIGAVGTLVTSGIIFPLIIKFKNFKQWISSMLKCFLAFVSSIVVAGQVPQVYTTINQIRLLLKVFAKGKPFISKFYQYTSFIRGLFLPNSGYIKRFGSFASYQLLPCKSIEWMGIFILLLCFISFILNRKKKMALVSLLWIIFSSVILLFAGWGTVENGLVLYSLYFSWAFYILIYMLIDKICKNKRNFKLLLLWLVSIMIFTNVYELFNIFSFGITYYP